MTQVTPTAPADLDTHAPGGPNPTWRDLADQLTPAQIQSFEVFEAADVVDRFPDGAAYLLHQAAIYARENAAGVRYADVQVPPGMEDDGWEEQGDDDWARCVYLPRRKAGDITTLVSAMQRPDGSMYDHMVGIYTHKESVELGTAADVRAHAADLAAAANDLLAAADELDTLATEGANR